MTDLLRTGILGYWQKSVWHVDTNIKYRNLTLNECVEEILYMRNIYVNLNKGS